MATHQNSKDSSLQPAFFVVKPVELWPGIEPLVAGQCEADGLVHVKCAGPVVPPFFFTFQEIVVTNSLRQKLAETQFGPFEFRPAVVDRVVLLHWEKWDRSAPRAPIRLGGDVWKFLESSRHSPSAAAKMEPLWELVVPEGAEATSFNRATMLAETEWIINPKTCGGNAIFKRNHHSGGPFFVTAQLRDWFACEIGEWVRFSPVLFERPPRARFYFVDWDQTITENPKLEDLERFIYSLDGLDIASPETSCRIALYNHAGWHISASTKGVVCLICPQKAGTVETFFEAANVRRLLNVPRAKQLELWRAFYLKDIEMLKSQPWDQEPINLFGHPATPWDIEDMLDDGWSNDTT